MERPVVPGFLAVLDADIPVARLPSFLAHHSACFLGAGGGRALSIHHLLAAVGGCSGDSQAWCTGTDRTF